VKVHVISVFVGFLLCLQYTAPPVATLATEGTLWFRDLNKLDCYGILPLLLAITNLINIEASFQCYYSGIYFQALQMLSACKHFE